MESAISGTRSDDSTRLKTHIDHYVAPNPAEAAVSPPIHDGSGRRTHKSSSLGAFSLSNR
ncbi:hypothetical protein M405DRAFT_830676 [Rhizopogon salebrosus TDB-379]|nr:hypothetical protein M405DRAFT_830676 [Rhizopogon salebrosus TDB-379]